MIRLMHLLLWEEAKEKLGKFNSKGMQLRFVLQLDLTHCSDQSPSAVPQIPPDCWHGRSDEEIGSGLKRSNRLQRIQNNVNQELLFSTLAWFAQGMPVIHCKLETKKDKKNDVWPYFQSWREQEQRSLWNWSVRDSWRVRHEWHVLFTRVWFMATDTRVRILQCSVTWKLTAPHV